MTKHLIYSLHFSEPSGWASSGAAQSEEERGWQLSMYCKQRSPTHCQQESPTGYQMYVLGSQVKSLIKGT